VVGAEASAEKLRPRLIAGAKQSLLTVFNDSAEEQTDVVRLKGKYRRAKNIHSGEDVAMGAEGVRVTVGYQDVVVLLLEP